MTGMLASVKNLAEARIALAGSVDIIDLKDPARGALGALSLTAIETIVKEIGGRAPVSATVGDLPMQPQPLMEAALCTAATGVDYVKIGFFSNDNIQVCVRALAAGNVRHARLVAVLFADLAPDWRALLPALGKAGFRGVMLDTAGKNSGSLRSHASERDLADFISQARHHGLFTGLAGSLRMIDVEPLLALQPDYLGFRTALCARGQRAEALDSTALFEIRSRIPQAMSRIAVRA